MAPRDHAGGWCVADFGGLADITEGFVSAAIDPSRWDAAMDAAAKATGSFGAILIPIRGRTPLFPKSESMRANMDVYVRDGWVHRDERYRSLPAFMRRGASCEFDFTTPEQIARNAFYQEFLAPDGLRWFAGVKIGDDKDIWCLSIQRTIAEGPFSQIELERLTALSRQMAGAAELARAFGFARIEGALQAFEASGSAVAMIDRSGEVLRLNHCAERLLGPDLQIVCRRVVSADRDATAALDRALHALLWSREADAFHAPVVLRRQHGRPIVAYPSRLPAAAREGFGLCVGSVVFVDLEARQSPAASDLVQAFGLTPTEAKLAAMVAEGRSLEDIAEQRQTSLTTARNQLKAVFAKTSTHRQSELVALLARLAVR
jgi:DNA-binding CsgD family transcriptional regulator